MRPGSVCRASLFALLAGMWFASAGLAAQPAKKDHQKQEIAAAKDRLQAERKQAEAARGESARAQAALQKAMDHAQQVRQKIEAEHDAEPALVQARQRLQQSQQSLEQLAAPLLTQVRASAEHKAAVAARDAARQKGDSRAYSDAIATIKRLEAAVIEGHPQAKAAQAAVTDSEAAVRTLVEKRDAAIAGDARFSAAKGEIDKARAVFAQAQQKLAGEVKQLQDAERRLEREEQEKRAQEQRQRQQQQQKHKKKR